MSSANTSSASDENDIHCKPLLTCAAFIIFQFMANMKWKRESMRLCCAVRIWVVVFNATFNNI
jgi:hypothetical protein